mgnify:FL=1
MDLDAILPHRHIEAVADSDAEREELKQTLERGLNRLHPRYREPLVLYYFEDMSYAEISEILRIPAATVGVRLKRGKEQLRKML